MGLNRSTLTYKPKPKQDEPLIARMKELAEQHKRWGVVSIHGVCRREGLVVNHKRSLRVYREQQLQIRPRPGRKRFSFVRAPIANPSAPNQVWSMDFIQPGKPQQNAIVESFNGKFREQCLNENIFFSIDRAREIVEEWREIYSDFRPNRSLKGKTPKEFEREHQNQYQHAELLSS